jgi:probable rRNA maturation factor
LLTNFEIMGFDIQCHWKNTLAPFFRDRRHVKKFIASVLQEEGFRSGTVHYVFCGDAYIRKMNRRFLSHDYPTDILTFDLSVGSYLTAEIYISPTRVKRNGKVYHSSAQNELLRVMLHGVLHLCGYSDKTSAEIAEMRQKEDLYLNRYLNREGNVSARNRVP